MLQSFVFMNSIDATNRVTNTKGELNSLRVNGNVPAIIYGGTEKNQKISLSKKIVKILMICGKKVLAIVPARLKSKRLKFKNMQYSGDFC